MSEVYKAQDTRLEIDVAVKVLRADIQSHEEWCRRLEREAKITAKLRHPLILYAV